MTSRPTYTVACLARHGVGPEVMAAASRALDGASRLHGFHLDEHHVPFGADALMRFGHPFPLSSRRAVLSADAVLVAADADDALEALEDELDLRATVVRVRFDERSEVTVFAPVADAWDWTVERAAAAARASRGRLALVGVDGRWDDVANELELSHDGLDVVRLGSDEALRALVVTPSRFDVLVCPPELHTPAAELAGCLVPTRRVSAWGRLAAEGPGVFGAEHGASEELAGHGVADPSSILLAAGLMLGEGLGERSAGVTLSAAVGRMQDLRQHPTARQLADVVVAELPLALSNFELAPSRQPVHHEAWEVV
jgi:3-isopropylmalate dehydrogenase